MQLIALVTVAVSAAGIAHAGAVRVPSTLMKRTGVVVKSGLVARQDESGTCTTDQIACDNGGCCPTGSVCDPNGGRACCADATTCTGSASGCADPTTVECDGFDFCCPPGLTCSVDENNEPLCGGATEASGSDTVTGTGSATATTSRSSTSRASTATTPRSTSSSTRVSTATSSSSTSQPNGAGKTGIHAFVGVAGAFVAGYALF